MGSTLRIAKIKLKSPAVAEIVPDKVIKQARRLCLRHAHRAQHVVPVFEKVGFFKGVCECLQELPGRYLKSREAHYQPLLHQIDTEDGQARYSLGLTKILGKGVTDLREAADVQPRAVEIGKRHFVVPASRPSSRPDGPRRL